MKNRTVLASSFNTFNIREGYEFNPTLFSENAVNFAFRGCTPGATSAMGFTSPLAIKDGTDLIHSVTLGAELGYYGVVKFERKVLPASAIKESLEKAVAAAEATGNKVRGYERRQMKSEIVQRLASNALSTMSEIGFYILPDSRLFIVLAGSSTVSERVASLIRKCVQTFPIQCASLTSEGFDRLAEHLQVGFTNSDKIYRPETFLRVEDTDKAKQTFIDTDAAPTFGQAAYEEGYSITEIALNILGSIGCRFKPKDFKFTSLRWDDVYIAQDSGNTSDDAPVDDGNADNAEAAEASRRMELDALIILAGAAVKDLVLRMANDLRGFSAFPSIVDKAEAATSTAQGAK